jgi:hypothetical protein
MVRAILAGKKTQARRVVNPQPSAETSAVEWNSVASAFVPWRLGFPTPGSGHRTGDPMRCPYGAPGDTLWVRETWRAVERAEDALDGVLFAADGAFVPIDPTPAAAERWMEAYDNGRHGEHWRPSIFMPRWASRLTLRVTGVRVERLQEISEEDARAEGMERGRYERETSDGLESGVPGTYRAAFAAGWDSINGSKHPWASNPYVWVVSFERVESGGLR